jgi:hypothetical protein
MAAMKRRARVDPQLGVRILSSRALHYDQPAEPTDDRPPHVRAASGIVVEGGRLVVVQDDASFLAVVTPGGTSAIALPRGLDGRRRFEVALGNKAHKLDLESCIAVGHELWAFGSGSLPIREKICRVTDGVPRVVDAAPLYRRMREAVGGTVNIEGAAHVHDELWLFHRGNTGPGDHGPMILHVDLAAIRAWLDANGALPAIDDVDLYDLGAIEGNALGFTDAVAARHRVFYLACAEHSPNAVDDGPVAGSQLGVITADDVRAAPLVGAGGAAVKAEGIALDPVRANHAWIVLDPDDPEQPSTLLEVELTGPW